MTLIDNIKLINGGGIFEAYAEDAVLINGRVLKNDKDVGLNEHQYNYFYTRHDDKPINIRSAERPMSSNTPYEIASPKVLVLQFKEYDLNGIMYAVLNVFNGNYNRLRYEVSQVEIRKEIILKAEIGEVRPMDGYRLIKISYTEFMPLDSCEEITCNGDVVIPLTNDVKVYINEVLRYEPSCNTNLELTLVDDLGNPIDATYNGTEIVVDISCEDVRVSNSDDSYDTNVVSGGDLELPDITVSNSDDSYSVTYPSVQDVELPDETINIVDENGNPLDSITFPVYTDPNIDISTYCPKDVFIKGIFAASESQLQSLTIDSDNAGTYTTLTQDGGSGTITFEINSTPATLPFTLSVADVLDVFRTTDTSLGHYKITGTYV